MDGLGISLHDQVCAIRNALVSRFVEQAAANGRQGNEEPSATENAGNGGLEAARKPDGVSGHGSQHFLIVEPFDFLLGILGHYCTDVEAKKKQEILVRLQFQEIAILRLISGSYLIEKIVHSVKAFDGLI